MLSATVIDPVVPASDAAPAPPRLTGRAEFLADLTLLDPAASTMVYVNGRALLLDGAIRLIKQLPADATTARHLRYLSISPDPFPAPPIATRIRPECRSDIPPTAADLAKTSWLSPTFDTAGEFRLALRFGPVRTGPAPGSTASTGSSRSSAGHQTGRRGIRQQYQK